MRGCCGGRLALDRGFAAYFPEGRSQASVEDGVADTAENHVFHGIADRVIGHFLLADAVAQGGDWHLLRRPRGEARAEPRRRAPGKAGQPDAPDRFKGCLR